MINYIIPTNFIKPNLKLTHYLVTLAYQQQHVVNIYDSLDHIDKYKYEILTAKEAENFILGKI